MKKRKKNLLNCVKRILAICLMIGMVCEVGGLNVYAASDKDVTLHYKKPVTKMLRRFDSYFGIGCKKSSKVKFDIYAKSTMAYLVYPQNLYGKSLSYVKKKLRNNMKLYFGSSTAVRFKKNKAQKAYSIATDNPSNLVQNVDGNIMYVGGNWSESAYPRGYVDKIVKKSSGKYEVTYKIMWYDWVNKKITPPNEYTSYTRIMGIYTITLKRANNQFGFIIAGAKRKKSYINRY